MEEDEENVALLHTAAHEGDMEEVRRLVDEEGADVNELGTDLHRPPLMLAARRGNLEVVRFLLDRGADRNLREPDKQLTALMLACLFGQVEVARLLLARGADPTIRGVRACTVLMVAAIRLPTGGVDEDGMVAVTRLLLEDGRVDVNAITEDGETALFGACVSGCAKVARVLLLEGCAGHALTDNEGLTAMDYAEMKGHGECVELLKWFEGELERCYCLAKAWHVNDDREAIRQAPTKAQARTAGEAQRAREEAAREYARGRVERQETLPIVEVCEMPRRSKRKGGEALAVEEMTRAVIEHVVMRMKEDPFIMLMELMGGKR